MGHAPPCPGRPDVDTKCPDVTKVVAPALPDLWGVSWGDFAIAGDLKSPRRGNGAQRLTISDPRVPSLRGGSRRTRVCLRRLKRWFLPALVIWGAVVVTHELGHTLTAPITTRHWIWPVGAGASSMELACQRWYPVGTGAIVHWAADPALQLAATFALVVYMAGPGRRRVRQVLPGFLAVFVSPLLIYLTMVEIPKESPHDWGTDLHKIAHELALSHGRLDVARAMRFARAFNWIYIALLAAPLAAWC